MPDFSNLDPAQAAQIQQHMQALGGNSAPQHPGHSPFSGRGFPMLGNIMPQIQGAFDQNQGNFSGFTNALMGMYPGLGRGGQMSGQPIPGAPNTQLPLNPGAGGPIQGQQRPMIGSSMGVTGATPATSPFGLPHY